MRCERISVPLPTFGPKITVLSIHYRLCILIVKSVMDTKCCGKCKHRLPTQNFGKSNRTGDKLDTFCKECRKEYRAFLRKNSNRMTGKFFKMSLLGKAKTYMDGYSKNKIEKIRQWNRKNPDSERYMKMISRYGYKFRAFEILGGKCVKCGETNGSFLEIDHIYNDGSIDRSSGITLSKIYRSIVGKSSTHRIEFIDGSYVAINEKPSPFTGKVQILCCNCNHKKMRLYMKKSNNPKRQNNLTKVREILGNKCSCCGNDDSMVLQIDHVNNDSYVDFNNNGIRSQDMCVSKIISGIDTGRYQLLCANCNRSKYINGGICAHKCPVIMARDLIEFFKKTNVKKEMYGKKIESVSKPMNKSTKPTKLTGNSGTGNYSCEYCNKQFDKPVTSGHKRKCPEFLKANPIEDRVPPPCLCGHSEKSFTSMKRHRKMCSVWSSRDKNAVFNERNISTLQKRYGEHVTNSVYISENDASPDGATLGSGSSLDLFLFCILCFHVDSSDFFYVVFYLY